MSDETKEIIMSILSVIGLLVFFIDPVLSLAISGNISVGIFAVLLHLPLGIVSMMKIWL